MEFGTIREGVIVVAWLDWLDVLWLIEDLHFCLFQGEGISMNESRPDFGVDCGGDAEIMMRRGYGMSKIRNQRSGDWVHWDIASV